MNATTYGPIVLGLAALALVGLLALRRSAKNKAARAAMQVTRMRGTFFRTLVITVVIVAVQAAVWIYSTDITARMVTLAVPALLASVTVARLFAVTTLVERDRKGHQR